MGRYLSPGNLTVAILAIVGGLIGAYGIRMALTSVTEPSPPQLRPMPVAGADLPVGRQVMLGDIALMPGMTLQAMRERGWDTTRAMRSSEQIIGRRLQNPVSQGQPFNTNDLYLQGMGPNPAAMLKPGFRAVKLEVDNIVASHLSPGTLVDVVFRTIPRPAQGTQLAIPETTRTLVERIEVLTVETLPSAPSSGSRSSPIPTLAVVFVAVTPQQAHILRAVEGRGEITLVIRPDSTIAIPMRLSPMTLEEALGLTPPPDSQGAWLFVTEIYRGGDREVLSFSNGRLAAR